MLRCCPHHPDPLGPGIKPVHAVVSPRGWCAAGEWGAAATCPHGKTLPALHPHGWEKGASEVLWGLGSGCSSLEGTEPGLEGSVGTSPGESCIKSPLVKAVGFPEEAAQPVRLPRDRGMAGTSV